MLGEVVDGQRPLQREIVQIVVEQHGHIAAERLLDDFLVAGAGAVHQHPGIGAGAIDDAVVGEMAALVQHAGIDRAAGIDLRHVAGGDVFQHGDGVRADEVDLLQARDIHEAGLGADGDVLVVDILVIGPGGPHAGPVLELGPQRAVPVRQNRKSPTQGHDLLSSCVSCAETIVPYCNGNYVWRKMEKRGINSLTPYGELAINGYSPKL